MLPPTFTIQVIATEAFYKPRGKMGRLWFRVGGDKTDYVGLQLTLYQAGQVLRNTSVFD